mgnify:CR=1 FL=1
MQNKMFDHDALMQKLGGVLVATEKGTATAELIIREDHLQGRRHLVQRKNRRRLTCVFEIYQS